ncbi:MAG: hypothetical protein JO204_08925 [Alphaproteobacteria bacterium]|nr:hypothetical protein [Alphaproteobacteria bacterium]
MFLASQVTSRAKIVVDISREALEDAATLSGASLSVRHACFKDQRSEFERCAVLRSQAPGIARVVIDTATLQEWRWRREKLLTQMNDEPPRH